MIPTRTARWCDWDADRLPDFERTAQGRAVVATTSDWRRSPGEAGQVVTLSSTQPDADGRHHRVYLVARVRFTPRDEVNERDDGTWIAECVEPTPEEAAVPFIRRAIDAAAQQDAHEQFVYEQTMRNTNGYGL